MDPEPTIEMMLDKIQSGNYTGKETLVENFLEVKATDSNPF